MAVFNVVNKIPESIGTAGWKSIGHSLMWKDVNRQGIKAGRLDGTTFRVVAAEERERSPAMRFLVGLGVFIATVLSLGLALLSPEIRDGFRAKAHRFYLIPTSQLAAEGAAKSLDEYCKIYNPKISSKEAQELTSQGKLLIADIRAGRAQPPQTAEAKQQCLAALTWVLMDAAISKKMGFREGTFVLEDPNNHIYTYLQGCDSYERSSSHYVGRSVGKHRGADVIACANLMPAGKRTLLFGQVVGHPKKEAATSQLFIKPENFSADHSKGYDFFMHGWEFVNAQWNKIAHPGSDDLSYMRKERVPHAVLAQFNEIVNQSHPQGDEKVKANAKADAKKYGIAYMHSFVEELKKAPNSEKLQAAIAQFDELIKSYDHCELRTGREVYFTAEEVNSLNPRTEEELLSSVNESDSEDAINLFLNP
jgi:hypothetical protein